MPERFHDNPSAVNRPSQGRKHDTAIPERGFDGYRLHGNRKVPEPSVCPDCGAVFHQGRWHWSDRPAGAAEIRCPACERIRDGFPAGFLSLNGEFLAAHGTEIENLIENVAAIEGREHALHRIIATERTGSGITITTTDIHLPRRLGEAIHQAYAGDLSVQYADEDQVVRVAWQR
jgi:NMD protein affecting ribosome stability and mRNA decay